MVLENRQPSPLWWALNVFAAIVLFAATRLGPGARSEAYAAAAFLFAVGLSPLAGVRVCRVVGPICLMLWIGLVARVSPILIKQHLSYLELALGVLMGAAGTYDFILLLILASRPVRAKLFGGGEEDEEEDEEEDDDDEKD